ncbi:hypothetical protein FQA39_LY15000 [Lamprigera yunnana]|nr:hypothetical protein FQA39_LY15000 [Lamprigera yunnana]
MDSESVIEDFVLEAGNGFTLFVDDGAATNGLLSSTKTNTTSRNGQQSSLEEQAESNTPNNVDISMMLTQIQQMLTTIQHDRMDANFINAYDNSKLELLKLKLEIAENWFDKYGIAYMGLKPLVSGDNLEILEEEFTCFENDHDE